MAIFPRLTLIMALAVASVSFLHAEPLRVRIIAANLTSGNAQGYESDNANHSNEGGAGARILSGLKPDIVLIQELNVGDGSVTALRGWVNRTFGDGYEVARESGKGLPNGIISRFPIVAEGEWDDVTQNNRDFAWAKIALPGGRKLWAVSVHLYSKKATTRTQEGAALAGFLNSLPKEDYVVLGGDFNTDNRSEGCIAALSNVLKTEGEPPTDNSGDDDTNSSRKKPYDWVLADEDLHVRMVSVKIGSASFEHGLVFDSRVFTPLTDVPPVREDDSSVQNMQHMAVIKDFEFP